MLHKTEEIIDFLLTARRKAAKCMRKSRSTGQHTAQSVLCSRYLHTRQCSSQTSRRERASDKPCLQVWLSSS
uniref:Uncharacterized protein n=1 Tax=Cyprinodon variegatus TaxID=28743 RepID=A0A3Q2GG09_CYPVA